MNILTDHSLSSLWYFAVLAGVWIRVSGQLFAVPADVIGRASRGEEAGLIAWLTLTLPRHITDERERVWLVGPTAAALSLLLGMAVQYRVEPAVAAFAVFAPMGVLWLVRQRLARRIAGMVSDGASPADIARPMRRHLRWTTATGLVTVALISVFAQAWRIAFPFGPA